MLTSKKTYRKRNALLVAALRSGKYKQATSMLRNSLDRMCCLGVACEVFRKATGRGEWKRTGGVKAYVFVVGDDFSSIEVPIAVRDWYNWDSCNPTLKPITTAVVATAAGKNDIEGCSFAQIAEAFEQTYVVG